MTTKKTCCFTGHRPSRLGFGENSPHCAALKNKISALLTDLIEQQGFTHFISGMALGVDMYAARAVLELKEKYPFITLECAIPCANQTKGWSLKDKTEYSAILSRCDNPVLLQQPYTPDCMQKRNRYMVDNSNLVLAVWNGTPSGTGNTVKYAKAKNVPVLLLDPLSLLSKNF